MTKKYHVYGLGNALVDMEFETTDVELKELKVEKGVMTLIEEKRQAQLLEQIWREPKKRACGGSAANTLIGIAQLGGRVFYSCKVAKDETGEFYYADLIRNGVDTNLQHQKWAESPTEGVTGKCLVLVTPDAERTMNTFLGVTASFSNEQLVESALTDSHWVYIEGYLVASPTGRAAAVRARELARANGVHTALTLSDPNMVKFFKDGLIEMIGGGVDLLFCNESEAAELAGSEVLHEMEAALKKYTKSFVITMGAKGALVYDGRAGRSASVHVPSEPARAVDTNGAGDLFAGAFLYGITHEMDFAEAATLAHRCSGKLITVYGPRLEPQVTRALLNEHLKA